MSSRIKKKLNKSNQEILFDEFENLDNPVIIGGGNIDNSYNLGRIATKIMNKNKRKQKKELIDLTKLIKID